MTDPRQAKDLSTFDAWNCAKKENIPSPHCNLPNSCALSFKIPEANITETRYLVTCRECPAKYPWLGDAAGTGVEGVDNYAPDN